MMNGYPEYGSVFYTEKRKNRPTSHRQMRRVLAGFSLTTCLVAVIILFLSLAGAAPAEADVNGQWTGRLVQDPGGIFESYPFSVTLYQHDGHLSGTTYISIPSDLRQYGVITLEGEVDGNSVRFSETRIIAQQLNPDWRWCLKTVEMHVDGNHLTGEWTAPGCPSGHLELTLVRTNS